MLRTGLFFLLTWVNSLALLSNEHIISSRLVPVEANTDTLLYVQVIWRHGDRSPVVVFDPEEEKLWPDGLGELTREGMAQHYRLGKWLRQRYGKFLNERFQREEVYVRSSDFNRTLMSALANMAGLFPPQNPQEIWDSGMPWQPVPVHSVPKLLDKQLYEDIPCPRADEEAKAIYTSNAIKEIEKKNAEFLKYLAFHINSTESGLGAMRKVYDALNCQYYHNTTHHWPSWVNQSIFDQVVKLYDIGSSFKFQTEFLRRIRGGPLVEEMYHRFKAKYEGRMGEKPKFYAYSAHDTTLGALLATLNIHIEVFPLYATAIILELHEIDGKPVIELFKKNITDSNLLYRTDIPGCAEPCSLDGFYNVIKTYIPENWEAECGFQQPSLTPYILAICLLAFTTFLFGGILALDIFLKYRPRSSPADRGSEPLINEADA